MHPPRRGCCLSAVSIEAAVFMASIAPLLRFGLNWGTHGRMSEVQLVAPTARRKRPLDNTAELLGRAGMLAQKEPSAWRTVSGVAPSTVVGAG